jgi:hypothetical protein
MSKEARIRELRHELAELRDPGPKDKEGHALFLTVRDSYISDLAELGATPEAPAAAPVTLRQIVSLKVHPPASSQRPLTQEVRHADSPGNAGAPGAPQEPETPMPKPHPAVSTASPEELLDTLLAKLSNATAEAFTALDKSAFIKARGRVYLHRNEIAKLVKAHGLEEPQLPKVPTNPWAFAPGKVTERPTTQDAPPQQLEVPSAPDPAMPHEAAPIRPIEPLHPASEQGLPEAAARIRALRAQALEVLPLCQGLTYEAGRVVHREVDLLADVLAMADRLAREAS